MSRRLGVAIGFATFLGLCGAATSARAATGTVSGRLLYFENQGNYCPDLSGGGRSCTGAKYLESTHFNQNLGVPETKVYVRRTGDNAILGQGISNAQGAFAVTWSLPGSGALPLMHVAWVGEERNSRFYVRNPDGSQRVFWTWDFAVVDGGNVNMGDPTWGWSGNPEPYANIYGGAWRAWSNSIGQSARMQSVFGGVTIRPFNSGTCATSCASGDDNVIFLDDSAAYQPQARVMHEMGHIASFRSHTNAEFPQPAACSFYGFGGGGCGWNLTSAEHEAAGFEESLATHFGDVGLYYPTATQPHTCLSASFCATNSFNIETSLGTSCGTNQNRTPINHIRYLWDLYDSNQDSWGDSISRGVWDVVDTLNSFFSGMDNQGKAEFYGLSPFNTIFIDDFDGRSPVDYRERLISRGGPNSNPQLSNNCGSPGD